MAKHEISQANYQLLVSSEDGRYHAVWCHDIAMVEPGSRPNALCGQGGCEPYDVGRMNPPAACAICFPWLRDNTPEARCVGAPRRDRCELNPRHGGAGMAAPTDWPGVRGRAESVAVSVQVGWVMTDHPGWLVRDQHALRVVRSGASIWALHGIPISRDRMTARAILLKGRTEAPLPQVFDPSALAGAEPLADGLRELGPVARWCNPDLWDALATAVMRQVIRAGQARKLYQGLCQAHGESVRTTAGPAWLFPSPQTVLALPDVEFALLGLAFKQRALRAVAEACLEFGEKLAGLDPGELVTELRAIPRVGPWTAGAAVADMTNDYALYPYADLAVRTWAGRLIPDRPWPQAEYEFAQLWRRIAGDQLGMWTLLTLAWGNRHVSHTSGAGL